MNLLNLEKENNSHQCTNVEPISIKRTSMRLLIILIMLTGTISCSNHDMNRTILTIVAHPDDETAVGAVLAKYTSTHKIYLLIATDGKNGVTEHSKIPVGDSLVRIREQETICSCNKLGIEPPIFLRFHDGLGIVDGLGEYFNQTSDLKEVLKNKIEEINPDLIITFGPDGDTGHPDHRIIGDLVTEVILKEGWLEKHPIYYLGWSKEETDDPNLNYVDPQYLDVKISYSEKDEEKLFESIRCHKSQFSEAFADEWIEAEKNKKSNLFYFRQLYVGTKQRTGF